MVFLKVFMQQYFQKKNVTFVVATTNIANMVIWAVLDM